MNNKEILNTFYGTKQAFIFIQDNQTLKPYECADMFFCNHNSSAKTLEKELASLEYRGQFGAVMGNCYVVSCYSKLTKEETKCVEEYMEDQHNYNR